jgi:hypothetical protein
MKLLVFYLYFAEQKDSGPAYMRILIFIINDMVILSKKKIWSEMANQDDSNDKCLSIFMAD